ARRHGLHHPPLHRPAVHDPVIHDRGDRRTRQPGRGGGGGTGARRGGILRRLHPRRTVPARLRVPSAGGRAGRPQLAAGNEAAVPEMTARHRLLLIAAAGLIGVLWPVLLPAYTIQMAELWLFIVFALTWDLVGGQMGYNSFGNVVFVGVGMYACAVVQVSILYSVSAYTAARGGGTEFVFPPDAYLTGLGLGLAAGAVAAVVVALCLGSLVLGMRGHYFAICTLGLGVAAGELAAGWDWLGAGAGMTAPPPPREIGDTNMLFYYMSLALAAVTFLGLGWLYRTRFVLAINAIRDDEDKAEAMGLDTTRIKVTAWAIGALF